MWTTLSKFILSQHLGVHEDVDDGVPEDGALGHLQRGTGEMLLPDTDIAKVLGVTCRGRTVTRTGMWEERPRIPAMERRA